MFIIRFKPANSKLKQIKIKAKIKNIIANLSKFLRPHLKPLEIGRYLLSTKLIKPKNKIKTIIKLTSFGVSIALIFLQ